MDPILTELDFGKQGKVFRSCMPFSKSYDPTGVVLDVAERRRISVVVMLASDAECARKSSVASLREEYAKRGWEVIALPISDYGVPDDDGALRSALLDVVRYLEDGRNVLAHCHAGIGRTGTFLACLRRQIARVEGDEAIDWVRSHVKFGVETDEQEEYVRGFDP